MKGFLKKQGRTVWLAVSIVSFTLWIAATILIRDATALALSYVFCITVLLFALPRAKKKKNKKSGNAAKKKKELDAYRLQPQDKGKIIEFPKK